MKKSIDREKLSMLYFVQELRKLNHITQTLKGLVERMKKITKAQKTLYPEFIVYIDTTVKGEEVTGYKIFTKAMEEKNILDAMKRAEQCIKAQGENIYLVDIYVKTDKENEQGEPLYKTALMTRVHMEYGKAQSSNWHFRDAEHSESEDGYYEWIPVALDFTQRNGILNWYAKEA